MKQIFYVGTFILFMLQGCTTTPDGTVASTGTLDVNNPFVNHQDVTARLFDMIPGIDSVHLSGVCIDTLFNADTLIALDSIKCRIVNGGDISFFDIRDSLKYLGGHPRYSPADISNWTRISPLLSNNVRNYASRLVAPMFDSLEMSTLRSTIDSLIAAKAGIPDTIGNKICAGFTALIADPLLYSREHFVWDQGFGSFIIPRRNALIARGIFTDSAGSLKSPLSASDSVALQWFNVDAFRAITLVITGEGMTAYTFPAVLQCGRYQQYRFDFTLRGSQRSSFLTLCNRPDATTLVAIRRTTENSVTEETPPFTLLHSLPFTTGSDNDGPSLGRLFPVRDIAVQSEGATRLRIEYQADKSSQASIRFDLCAFTPLRDRASATPFMGSTLVKIGFLLGERTRIVSLSETCVTIRGGTPPVEEHSIIHLEQQE